MIRLHLFEKMVAEKQRRSECPNERQPMDGDARSVEAWTCGNVATLA